MDHRRPEGTYADYPTGYRRPVVSEKAWRDHRRTKLSGTCSAPAFLVTSSRAGKFDPSSPLERIGSHELWQGCVNYWLPVTRKVG